MFIGATVTAIIAILAPLTQSGINPARDLGPRLVAFLAGWNKVAIPGPRGGFFLVYVAGPLLGGTLSALCFRHGLARLMNGRQASIEPKEDPTKKRSTALSHPQRPRVEC